MSQEIKLIHVPLKAWLDEQPGLCYSYSRPDKRTGSLWSEADFIIYAGPCHCIMVEAKDKLTAISAKQKQRHAMLAKIGVKVHIIRSFDAGRELVTEWKRQLPTPDALADNVASPVAVPEQLYKLGGAVYRKTGDKHYTPVRPATGADAGLPLPG